MSRAAAVARALALLLVAGLPATAVAQTFEATAPGEVVSDATITNRTFVVGDMQRIGLVSTVEQGPRGIVRAGVGPSFHTSTARDLYFGKLAGAYFEWRGESGPLVVEIWDHTGKIGEYSEGTFLMGTQYGTPVGCPEDGDGGRCGPEVPPLAPAPPAVQTAAAEAEPPTEAARHGEGHSGLHVTLGVGGGSAALSCDGCNYSRETSLSGYLAVAGAVRENVLVGIEGTGWTQREGAQIYSLMAQATGYSNAASGLFLTAGLGLVGRRESSPAGDLTGNGLGFSARLGYEVRMGNSVLLIPYLGFLSTLGSATFKFNGNPVGDYRINNIQFGLGAGIN